MTNFDPGGFLMLLTVIPAVVAGVISIGLAHLAARLGYGEYERNVMGILGVLIGGWVIAALVVSTGMLLILAVTLAMAGAYLVTRSITTASYGWVLGVVLMFVVFGLLSGLNIYQGVNQTGVPQDLISQHLEIFYYAGLLVFGAIAGKTVALLRAQRARQ